MRYIKFLGIVLLLNSCNSSIKNDFMIDVMDNDMKNDFFKLQDIYSINRDSSSNGRFYIMKPLCNENILVSERQFETYCYKKIGEGYELVFDFGSPSKPFYVTRIDLIIKNNYSYEVEMDCITDREDEVIRFNSIKKRCKYGALYLSDSISDKLKVLHGFFNIKIYTDNEFKELEYTSCLPFSVVFQMSPVR